MRWSQQYKLFPLQNIANSVPSLRKSNVPTFKDRAKAKGRLHLTLYLAIIPSSDVKVLGFMIEAFQLHALPLVSSSSNTQHVSALVSNVCRNIVPSCVNCDLPNKGLIDAGVNIRGMINSLCGFALIDTN